MAANYGGTGLEANTLWGKVFVYKRKEFPNLCNLAEIVLCLSGSNSTVERAFSLLTLLLSDKRLSMSHKTMKDVILININDKLRSDVERNDIIKMAAEKYLSKRRTKRLLEPPSKKTCSEFVDSDESSASDENSDEDNSGNSGESSFDESD